MLYYMLIAIPVIVAIVVIGVLYANRRQARVTALVEVSEPDIDLSQMPALSPNTSRDPVPNAPRDPKLAGMTTEQLILEVLSEVQDPEIPLSIVDLGLVYEVQATKDGVTVKMSMTAPDCPSHHTITQDARGKLEEAGFPNPKVEVVWDPPWTPHRISEEGKKKLGMSEERVEAAFARKPDTNQPPAAP